MRHPTPGKGISVFARLTTPAKIQDYLDGLNYNCDYINRCPIEVIKARKAHCFDGAIFAAAALRYQGAEPLLMDLRAVHDDDHVVAVFVRKGFYGALGKSNYVGLRYREPVYRSLRELAMSYFEQYHNIKGEKTLREYSRLLNLKRFDSLNWLTSNEHLDKIADEIDRVKHWRLLTKAQERALLKVDSRSYKASTVGLDPKGVYRA